MGFRFRKTIGIIPGIRLNVSKSGVSASVGGHGATANVGTKGVTGSVGIPGTGMSYRKSLTPTGLELASKTRWSKWWLLALLVIAALGFFYLRLGLPDLMKSPAVTAVTGASPIAKAIDARSTAAHVATATGNCRSAPGRTGAVVTKLARGDAVTVLERADSWTRVNAGGKDCWLSNRVLKKD